MFLPALNIWETPIKYGSEDFFNNFPTIKYKMRVRKK